MGQTDLKPTAQGQVESSINDTINFIMAKVAAGEIDAATATELIAAARKDYESNVPVTTSAQQAVQLQQTANPYQADPQTAYAVPEMEPEQTPIDYGQFATSTNYPHTYDVEDSSDVDMDALSGIASDVFDKQPRKKLSRKERKARAKEMKKLQKESNAKLKANAKSNKSIQKQLKDRDKELSAVQKGYDFSILPQELKYSKEETEDVIDNLQNKNQRLYVFTGLFYTYAPTKKQLDNQVLSIISAARQNSIEVSTYEYRQRQGFNSILPLGHNHCEISRMSTTAEVSILMPFATMELDDKGGNYYGQNKHSSNLIFCNRKLLASPMGFVCGKTGSGKGMAVKTEMTGTILSNPTDEIYIIDRAGEYTGISSRYGGVTYNFAVDSDTYLNPFDTVSVESLSPDAQLAFKIDAMLAQAGASAAEAGRDLGEEDQSIITRCVQEAFFDARQRGEQPPLLEDFYNKLLEQPEPEAKTIALRYERFVTGAQSFFNHQSNVDFKSRIVDFNLKDLPDSMLVFGLINVCEAVRNRMYFNAKRGVRTWLYVEEMQSLFAYPTVLNYFSRFSNEGRKFGLLLTGISQNAVAMLKNKAAQNLVLNSDFLLLLKQSPLDRAEWVRLLGLSEQEEEFIDESVEPGDGLLIAGGARVPIRGKFPSGNVLYDLFSTNPNEAADKKRMQEFAAREKSRLE